MRNIDFNDSIYFSEKEIVRREDALLSMYKWLAECDPVIDQHLTHIIQAKIAELRTCLKMVIPLSNPNPQYFKINKTKRLKMRIKQPIKSLIIIAGSLSALATTVTVLLKISGSNVSWIVTLLPAWGPILSMTIYLLITQLIFLIINLINRPD